MRDFNYHGFLQIVEQRKSMSTFHDNDYMHSYTHNCTYTEAGALHEHDTGVHGRNKISRHKSTHARTDLTLRTLRGRTYADRRPIRRSGGRR